MEEFLQRLANDKLFSILDAKDGCFLARLDEPSSNLATFNTAIGLYRWLRMPQGTISTTEEYRPYQRYTREAIRGINGVEVIADGILVYGVLQTRARTWKRSVEER